MPWGPVLGSGPHACLCFFPCFRGHTGMCVPKAESLTSEMRKLRPKEAMQLPQGHTAHHQHRLSLHRGSQGHHCHWPPNSMTSYKDTASATPTPGSQPLPQFVTGHPTAPIWTHVCSQTNDPVWGFENWVTCREGAISKAYLGLNRKTPSCTSNLPKPGSQGLSWKQRHH